MRGSRRSPWLSAANQMTGWWLGHAANALRQAQRAAAKAATRRPAKRPPRRAR